MVSLDPAMDGDLPLAADAAAPEPLWRRFLQRFAGNARTGGEPLPSPGLRPPVYRITRVWANRWVVLLPGSAVEYAFDSAETAEAFVREQCTGAPAMIEIQIGELYVAARLEPNRPALFRACR